MEPPPDGRCSGHWHIHLAHPGLRCPAPARTTAPLLEPRAVYGSPPHPEQTLSSTRPTQPRGTPTGAVEVRGAGPGRAGGLAVGPGTGWRRDPLTCGPGGQHTGQQWRGTCKVLYWARPGRELPLWGVGSRRPGSRPLLDAFLHVLPALPGVLVGLGGGGGQRRHDPQDA